MFTSPLSCGDIVFDLCVCHRSLTSVLFDPQPSNFTRWLPLLSRNTYLFLRGRQGHSDLEYENRFCLLTWIPFEPEPSNFPNYDDPFCFWGQLVIYLLQFRWRRIDSHRQCSCYLLFLIDVYMFRGYVVRFFFPFIIYGLFCHKLGQLLPALHFWFGSMTMMTWYLSHLGIWINV